MSDGVGESHLAAGFFPLIMTGALMAATDTCTCAAVLAAELSAICGGLCSATGSPVGLSLCGNTPHRLRPP